MRIKITEEQKKKLFALIENNESWKDKLSPDVREMYKNVFGSKDANPEFKKGYEKGYMDGWLDAKGNLAFNEKYSWDKYSEKK